MKEEITVNGYPVVISVGHTIYGMDTFQGVLGTRFVAECHSLEEVSEVINNPDNTPEVGWYWDIQFQDKVVPIQKCDCPERTCKQAWSAFDEVGLDCRAVYP